MIEIYTGLEFVLDIIITSSANQSTIITCMGMYLNHKALTVNYIKFKSDDVQ
jgi:hypothetical protein